MDGVGLGERESGVVAKAPGGMTVSLTQERSHVVSHRALLTILSGLADLTTATECD